MFSFLKIQTTGVSSHSVIFFLSFCIGKYASLGGTFYSPRFTFVTYCLPHTVFVDYTTFHDLVIGSKLLISAHACFRNTSWERNVGSNCNILKKEIHHVSVLKQIYSDLRTQEQHGKAFKTEGGWNPLFSLCALFKTKKPEEGVSGETDK